MITLPDTIGLPPSSSVDDPLILNSMPQMHITPCEPKWGGTSGLGLFRLVPVWDNYIKMLEKMDYTTSIGGSLKIAFLADSFPTDTFVNTYSESFLNRFSDVISSGVFEAQQILGTRKTSGLMGATLKALENLGGPFESLAKGAGKAVSGVASGISDTYKAFIQNAGKAGTSIDNTVQTLKNLLDVGRIDFPMIWKNSGFTPSYTFTVRLYNPNPSNLEMRKKYITGPLAALLLLGLPQTDDGSSYRWPFFHKIIIPGIVEMPSAYIGNITVVKGGDQQQIAYNQTLGMVDVRIEIGSLFDSMVAGDNYESNDRPTLKKYIETIEGSDKSVLQPVNKAPIPNELPTLFIRNASNTARQPQESADLSTEAPSRVPQDDVNQTNTLLADQPIIA